MAWFAEGSNSEMCLFLPIMIAAWYLKAKLYRKSWFSMLGVKTEKEKRIAANKKEAQEWLEQQKVDPEPPAVRFEMEPGSRGLEYRCHNCGSKAHDMSTCPEK